MKYILFIAMDLAAYPFLLLLFYSKKHSEQNATYTLICHFLFS